MRLAAFVYRLYNPYTHLPTDRFEVAWHGPDPSLHPGDVVVGQRITGRNEAWLDLCNTPGVTTVYDIDDNILVPDPTNPVIHSIFAPQAADTAANIAAATVVTASTQKLAAQLAHLNTNIVVLPNCLHPTWLQAPLTPDRPLVVGWAGSMFHGNDFAHIPAQAAEFHRRHPQVGWHLIGHDYLAGAPIPRRVSPFQPMPSYRAALDFTMGIAPLQNTPFNDAKSFCKLLEYGGRGIPAVAANVGQYPEFIEHGANGFLMDDPSDMVGFLELLLDDDVRRQMSAAAYQTASEYAITAQIHQWEDLLREV